MVASGGCSAAALAASAHVGRLHLVDPNPAQLALTRLKLHLLYTCDTYERMRLLGHAPMPVPQRAAALEEHLNVLNLSPDILGSPIRVASLGPDHAGRYEWLFRRLREALDEWYEELLVVLQMSDVVEQSRRVAPNTGLGRAMDEAFEAVMRLDTLVQLFGEAATANRVEPFATHFARRTRHILATMPAATNPYLWQMWTGQFPDEVVSPWLTAGRPLHLPAVTWSTTLMNVALREVPEGEFDIVHLSNILDWLNPDDAQATLELAHRALAPGGCVILRQLNSTLDVRSVGPWFLWDDDAEALHARDRSFFYRALHLGRKA
jgi:S-adenosylmethionine-diacylglycerol 3-amino-3-carboxypropyl transferase